MTISPTTAFLVGLAVGLVACWLHTRSLKAKIRMYETYIHERLDKQFVPKASNADTGKDAMDLRHPAPDQTVSPLPAKEVNPRVNSRA